MKYYKYIIIYYKQAHKMMTPARFQAQINEFKDIISECQNSTSIPEDVKAEFIANMRLIIMQFIDKYSLPIVPSKSAR